VLAHQYLGQIEVPVLRALSNNTSIKMAASIEGADRSAMARDMNTTPDFIRDENIGSFATFVRGVTPHAISMRFPQNALSRFARMTEAERTIVQQRNRQAYANPVGENSEPMEGRSEHTRETPFKSKLRDPDAS
jgi:hypothetical protein